MAEKPLEYEFCAWCHEHADFTQDDSGKWLSVCCGAAPVPVDVEPPDIT